MAAVRLSPGPRGLLVLIIIAVVIFVGCALGYVGAAGKMSAVKDDLTAKQNKVKESTQIAQKLEKSRYTFEDTKSQIRFLETSVATEAYVPTLLKQLEDLAKSVNLKVTEVRPSAVVRTPPKPSPPDGAAPGSDDKDKAAEAKPAPRKPYDEINIAVEFKGNYDNVLDFLYRLTTFPKILAVNGISISPADTELSYDKSPALNVKMTVTAFVLKKDEPVTLPGQLNQEKPAGSVTSLGEGRGRHEAG